MDPFLENQEWEDFHTRLMTAISDRLSPGLEPDYLVRVERRVYVEQASEDPGSVRRADVAILSMDSGPALGRTSFETSGTAVAVECEVPMPVERSETYLFVRHRVSMEVVTVIELLSPANKRRNGTGRHEYLAKRTEFLSRSSHLVELDLLRGGDRLPLIGPVPAADYFAIVSRANRRPRCEVYAWTIRDPLPTIPIPLKRGDADAMLPLQDVFEIVYQRARYDLSMNYNSPLEPPFSSDESNWLNHLRQSK